ncbi:MAG: HIT family protein [Flavobacteriales bacterium]|jgi:histidine triad (HIT) family protein|nr:HIT family protein [Flavobacteriales bacterium]
MASIFTKIVNREIPAYIIAESEECLAFLDVFPITEGHVLVIPKKEIDNIFDLSDDELSALHIFAKKVAKAMEQNFDCTKIGMSVVGLEVPHAHIHLIPINSVGDMDFNRPKLSFEKEEFEKIQNQIKSFL